MSTIALPRSGFMRMTFTESGGRRSFMYSPNLSSWTRVGLILGLVRSTSSRPRRKRRIKRSLIMSIEETFTPSELSSLVRSCFLMVAEALYPVSMGMAPLLMPLARASISSLLNRLPDSLMVAILRWEGSRRRPGLTGTRTR